MAKKTGNKTGTASEFSPRPRRKNDLVVEEPVVEEPQEVSNTVPEEEEVPVEEPEIESEPKEVKPQLDYVIYTPPKGAKENGAVLSVVLSILILIVLSFLVYYEHSWRLQEQEDNAEVQVDNEFDVLRVIVKNYVQTISDSNKDQLCKQLYSVYMSAAESKQDVETTLKVVKEKSREILGFDEKTARTNEAEWQKLFGSTGIIDNWLITANVEITDSNKKEVFTAIAKGLY